MNGAVADRIQLWERRSCAKGQEASTAQEHTEAGHRPNLSTSSDSSERSLKSQAAQHADELLLDVQELREIELIAEGPVGRVEKQELRRSGTLGSVAVKHLKFKLPAEVGMVSALPSKGTQLQRFTASRQKPLRNAALQSRARPMCHVQVCCVASITSFLVTLSSAHSRQSHLLRQVNCLAMAASMVPLAGQQCFVLAAQM